MIDLRAEVANIINRTIAPKGMRKAIKDVLPMGGFGEAQREQIIILLLEKIEELENEINDLRPHTKK